MVKTIANFTQVNMKEFTRHSTVRIQPMFRITPKSFNAIQMISSFGFSSFFANYNMIPSNCQGRICMPIIRVVQTAWLRMCLNKTDDFTCASSLNGKYLNLTIPLQNPQHHNLACSTPTTLPRKTTAKHCLITLNNTLKRLLTVLLKSTAGPYNSIKLFTCRWRSNISKAHAIDRNTVCKQLDKFAFRTIRETAGLPCCLPRVSLFTFSALISAICQFPCSCIMTLRTMFHLQTSIT